MTPPEKPAPPPAPSPAPAPAPIFRISLGNATLLSVLYLVVATLNDVARRLFTWRWTEVVSDHLEEFPSRTLRWFGLFAPLKQAYLDELLGPLAVRLALGLTMVTLIYALAMAVGVMMWTARFLYQKVQPGSAGRT